MLFGPCIVYTVLPLIYSLNSLRRNNFEKKSRWSSEFEVVGINIFGKTESKTSEKMEALIKTMSGNIT